MQIEESDFPALYNAADTASLKAQNNYFNTLRFYLILLITASFVSFKWTRDAYGAIASAALFLAALGVLVWLKVKKSDDIWYNGRAVAESVKTRTWRWIMKAEPYINTANEERAQKELLWDLKAIFDQNRSLSDHLEWTPEFGGSISQKMIFVRALPWQDRLTIYKNDRIDNQCIWYSTKSHFNKRRAKQWFAASTILHSITILMLLYSINNPSISLPIGIMATAASSVITWVQTKKHNELNSSYALAAHEIVLIKGEAVSIKDEPHLSKFVVNSEAAFSREHTQWFARKNI